MTAEDSSPLLHHVVFAVAPQRQTDAAKLFTDLGFGFGFGFGFEDLELAEHGLHVHLDWNRGIELIARHRDRPRRWPHRSMSSSSVTATACTPW
jgi:hypothetical protein